jgi:hypothetical protein
MLLAGLQPQPHMNAPDDKYVFFQLDFTHRFAHQPSGGRINVTRLQRAPKGSGKSTCCRRDDVIECRGARLRDGAVDAKDYRLRFGREIGFANRSLHAPDADFRTVDKLRT